MMTATAEPLSRIFDGWDTYQQSLVQATAPLSSAQLAWRPAPQLRSGGQLASHISFGRIGWFQRMDAAGSAELARQAEAIESENTIADNAAELVRFLELSWQMIADTLAQWTVADFSRTYRQAYQGQTYAVSRQWTIGRILAHDLHHGVIVFFPGKYTLSPKRYFTAF